VISETECIHRNRNKLINAKVALKKADFGENGVTKKSRAVLSSVVRYRGTYARARSKSIIRKYKEAPIKENAA